MNSNVKSEVNLRLTSWNISGIMYNLKFLRQCLHDSDIFCLQEHWLYPDSLSFLDTVDPNFNTWGRCCSELNLDSISRRGKGGLAFFWRKSLGASFEVLENLGNDRIAVVNVKPRNSEQFFIIGVYSPCTSESVANYKSHVDLLENILYQLHERGTIILMGDFNAHVGNFGGPRSFNQINSRGQEIKKIIETFQLLSVNSQHGCVGPIETFYSNNGCTKTTVDHIFIPEDKVHSIFHCAVIDDCSSNLSFHLPIYCVIKAKLLIKSPKPKEQKLLWKKLDDEHYRNKYQDELTAIFQSNYYQDLNFNSAEKLEETVEDIVDKLKSVALSVVPISKSKPYLKSYWNSSLTSLKKSVAHCRRKWIKVGRPRGREYQSYIDYKHAKQQFRKAQRRAIYGEETKCFQNLEKQYDVDRSTFTKKISRRCGKKETGNVSLQVDGKYVDDEEELLTVWKKHYEELYTPKDEPGFDNEFKKFVEERLVDFAQSSFQYEDPLDEPFEIAEVGAICEKLPNGKAGGLDNLTYEHIKYGGITVYKILTKIFNAVRDMEYIVENWLVGNIISLFKNGKKNKHDKDNYRGITLLNIIGKIFERLVLNRWIPTFRLLGIPNAFQFAYQENKSCVHSSFVLQEMIYNNVEKGSKVYCCFLDSSKAFDTVWLDGLFFKLFKIGMKGKSWRILRKWYQKMRCCVSLIDNLSPMFLVGQGVRQGGVLSPWLFLCYNNDIPDVLGSTGYGLTVNNIHSNSVLVADDLTLLSLQVEGLQCLINTIENYSNKWRFQFNPGKTVVVTFGETTQMNNLRKPTRKWYIKEVEIEEKSSWVHVGIILSGNFSSYERSTKAAKKGKAAMGSLMSAGVRPGGLNPICGVSVWKSFGIPAMLYGCEVWSNLTVTEKEILNRSSSFAAKRMQGLGPSTHTAGALGTIGMWTTTAFIDKMKLLFFGSLCRSSPVYLHKQLFIERLFSYLTEGCPAALGYVPDILSILKTYNLYSYLEGYLKDSTFPSKSAWRNITVDTINQHQIQTWKEEMLKKPNLHRLRRIHQDLRPVVHWEVARRNPIHRVPIANLVNLLCGNNPTTLSNAVQECENYYTCKLCNKELNDINYHFIMNCSAVSRERNMMWDEITDHLPIQIVSYLNNMDDEDLFDALIGGSHPVIHNSESTLDTFFIVVANEILNIFNRVKVLYDDF